MKKLKILLLFSCLLLCICKCNIRTQYSIDTKEIIGTIIEYQEKENYTTILVKGKEKVLVYVYDTIHMDHLKIGDTVLIKGEFKKIEGSRNFNLFDYQKYMLSKKVIWKVIADDIIVKKQNTNIFYTIKNWLQQRASKNSYLQLFILGNNTLDSEVKQSYQANGVSHLFAISGMHISLFIMVLTLLLKKVIKKTYLIHTINSVFLVFYMFITGFTVSVVRASLFTILLGLKDIFHWNIKNQQLLFYLFIACICYNPYYVYQVGFWFTFLITFAFLHIKMDKQENYFIRLFKSSCISFIVSIPLLMYHFFSVNFLTPIWNLFFIPFITFIVFPLSIITFVLPFLSPILDFLTGILEQISLTCSNMPFLTFTFCKVSIFIVILDYIILYFILIKFIKNKYYYVIILFILLLFHYLLPYARMYPTITMIDIGQGDATLIELERSSATILIDTGGIYSVNQTDTILLPYLKSRGIRKIDYLILTHGDYDHMGEAVNLVNNFKVDKVVLNCGAYNDLENAFIKVLDKKKIKYYACVKELNIQDNKLYFLNTKEYNNENDNSSVIYTELNNYKFLFMGDAGVEVEKAILDKYNLSNIDFLKVGHHGSNTSSSKYFIDSINPKYSLISVGKNNRYGHPKNVVLETLSNSKIYRTDLNGSIQIKLNKNGYEIGTCSS